MKTAILLLFLLLPNTVFAISDTFNNYTGSVTGHTGWTSSDGTVAVHSNSGPDNSNALVTYFDALDSRAVGWTVPVNSSEIYIQFDAKLDCGVGSCVGGAKFLKIFGVRTAANTEYANMTMQLDYTTVLFQGVLYGATTNVRDAGSIVKFNGGNTTEEGGTVPSVNTAIGSSIDPIDGLWHNYKYHCRYNDNGQNNGVVDVWVDGVKVLGVTGMNIRSDNNSLYIDRVELAGWHQSYGGTPYYIYYDNFDVSPTDFTATPPITSTNKPSARYTATQSVTLTCADDVSCTATKYCYGVGCTPTTTYETPFPVLKNLAKQTYCISSTDGTNDEVKKCFDLKKQIKK